MEKDIIHDEEYLKYKEEQLNTMKMSTILKSLNGPGRVRSKKAGGTLQSNGANQVHGMSAGSAIGSGRGGMRRYNSSTKSSQKFVDNQGGTLSANNPVSRGSASRGLNPDLQAN